MHALLAEARRSWSTVRDWQVWTVPRLPRAYLLGVTALAFTLAVPEAARTPWRPADLLAFAALLTCGVVAIESSRTIRELRGGIGRDLQTVWYLAIATTLPPAYALIAPLPLTVYKLWRVPRAHVYRRVFSNATISLAYGSASFLFHSLAGPVTGARPGTAWHAAVWAGVVAGCGAAAWAVNNGLLLVAVRIADPAARIRGMFANREAMTADAVELNLAVVASVLVAISWYLIPLPLLPVVMYRRYLLRAQFRARARIDAETGLLDAGTWQREAEVARVRAIRDRTPLALAIVGIDHLEDEDAAADQVVRDELLRGIASIFVQQLPGYDLIARHEGEEFAILLPQVRLEQAQRISERLRDYIAAEPIAIESSTDGVFVLRPTISVGVADLSESRRTLAELIAASGAALAQARSTGWSKVSVYRGVNHE
jgi:diguanylate cyclase (GGDEF)-like protein